MKRKRNNLPSMFDEAEPGKVPVSVNLDYHHDDPPEPKAITQAKPINLRKTGSLPWRDRSAGQVMDLPEWRICKCGRSWCLGARLPLCQFCVKEIENGHAS